MFIIKPDLSAELRERVLKELAEVVTKNNGKISNQNIWAEKRKLAFSIKKYQEGIYYLMQFDIPPSEILNLRQTWKLSEDILRFQILKIK